MKKSTTLILLVLVVASIGFALSNLAISQSTSFHMTRKGHANFYASSNGGYETITNIPINALRCMKCHPGKLANGTPIDTATYQPSCNDCHNFSVGNVVPDSICKRCHSRQKVEIANYTDVHRTANFTCVTCHIKNELHADATPYFSTFDTTQGKNCQTVGCHNVIPVTPDDSIAHATHISKMECATCHARSVVNCYNCHFDTEIWQGMRGFKRPIGQLKGFIMLARHVQTGKVGIVNYQSIIYQGNKSFVAWGPYAPHTIMPKDSTRACGQCHNAPTITEYNNTSKIVVAKWDSVSVPKKIAHTQGMIPVPPDYQTSLIFDFANYTGRLDTAYTNPAMWVFAKRGLNGQQMLSRYVLPLTASQMTKLGSTIGIQPIGNEIPARFTLSQNYPNPFNPSTVIRFSLPKNTNAELKVFNSLGHEVVTLVKNSSLRAGNYEVEFSAVNLSSGIYFYRLTTSDYSQTMKMVLVK